jgi:hypothetical protein
MRVKIIAPSIACIRNFYNAVRQGAPADGLPVWAFSEEGCEVLFILLGGEGTGRIH